MNNKKVYLDLDGVVADFTSAALIELNLPVPHNTFLPNDFSYLQWEEAHGTRDGFFSIIKGHDFWFNKVKPYPWAQELIKIVDRETNGNWCFLSKPVSEMGSYSGKYEWVKRYFGINNANRLILTRQPKSDLCRRLSDILIDDNDKNINDWGAAGGDHYQWREMTPDIDDVSIKLQLTFAKQICQPN